MNQRFTGRKRIAFTIGVLRIEEQTAEFINLVAFNKLDEGSELGLEASERHNFPLIFNSSSKFH